MRKYLSVIFIAGLLLLNFEATALEAEKVTASSVEDSLYPQNSVDRNMQTRWGSEFSDNQWLKIDLGKTEYIVGLTLYWETAYALNYDILISENDRNYKRVFTEENSDGNIDDIYFGRKKARFIKLNFNKRATCWGFSLWEIDIKGLDEEILIEASSSLLAHKVDNILDGNPVTYWHNTGEEDAELIIDLSHRRYLGGLTILWTDDYAKDFEILASEDGNKWRLMYQETNGNGGKDKMSFNLLGEEFIKIKCNKSSNKKGYGIKQIQFKKWKDMAKNSQLDIKRGLAGYENSPYKVFIGKDGSFSSNTHPCVISCWIYDEDKGILITPSTLSTKWRLVEGGIPISEISWQENNLKVNTTIFSNRIEDKEEGLITFYKVSILNEEKKQRNIKFYLVIKESPLSDKKITSISKKDNLIKVNQKPLLFLKEEFSECKEDKIKEAANEFLSSKFKIYERDIKLTKRKDFYFLSPLSDKKITLSFLEGQSFSKNLKQVKDYWKKRVPFKLSLPEQEFVDCFYASIYYILICMDDYELHPGPLNYARFFLHDAVDMASALDKVGLEKVVDKTLDYFNYKRGGGYLDELGGSLFSLYEHYRITKNIDYLRAVYPRIKKGCELIKELRQPQLKKSLKDTALYGLLPKSVSQDNFKHPAYLYVDDWWAIIGLKSAYQAACILNKKEDAEWIKKEYESLHDCTLKSIKKAMQRDDLNYMPGFADDWPDKMKKVEADYRILGDAQMAWAHRPALFPGDTLGISIPYKLFKKSYKKYWQRAGKFSGYDGGWFVEYENLFWGYNVKLAHPLICLGMRDVALKNIYWSINNQSCPCGWSEAMPTKINKEGRRVITDGIVGDVPHGWVAAHYVLSLRDMLLREKDNKLILLSCIPESWLDDGKTIEVKNAPTYFGNISFKMESFLNNSYIKLDINMKNPPKDGYVLGALLDKDIKKIKLNGRIITKGLRERLQLPSDTREVVIYY